MSPEIPISAFLTTNDRSGNLDLQQKFLLQAKQEKFVKSPEEYGCSTRCPAGKFGIGSGNVDEFDSNTKNLDE